MNFLSSDDVSKDGINKIFEIADYLKGGVEELAIKPHAMLALYFERPSTRTRLSFQTAITQLGGNAVYIDPKITERARGEALSDTTKTLSDYVDFIAARMYKHGDLLEMASAASVPVINALTDLEHPTQALADVYTIREHVKDLRDVKVAFLGDIANNTANSLTLTAAKMGADVVLIGPKSCIPNSKMLNRAREYSKIVVTDSLEDGLDGANIVYTDSYLSSVEESGAEKMREKFMAYQVNKKARAMADESALVMHCLPAHRGEEITSDVLDGKNSIVWEQAKNKLLLNKALLIYLSEQRPTQPKKYSIIE